MDDDDTLDDEAVGIAVEEVEAVGVIDKELELDGIADVEARDEVGVVTENVDEGVAGEEGGGGLEVIVGVVVGVAVGRELVGVGVGFDAGDVRPPYVQAPSVPSGI